MDECIGKKYRYTENNYINLRGAICLEQKMTPLKKQSCPGCEKCGWIDDDLHESIVNVRPPIIKKAANNGIYTVEITNISRDWETGYVDDYDFEFVLVDQPR